MSTATKTTSKNYSFKTTYVVYASPEKVFEALTDSSIIATWGGGLSIVEHKKGGKFEMFDGWVKGEVLSFILDKELSYSWLPAEWKKNSTPSVVLFKLKVHPAGTEIILEHTGLPTEDESNKTESGWVDFVLEPLNEYFTS